MQAGDLPPGNAGHQDRAHDDQRDCHRFRHAPRLPPVQNCALEPGLQHRQRRYWERQPECLPRQRRQLRLEGRHAGEPEIGQRRRREKQVEQRDAGGQQRREAPQAAPRPGPVEQRDDDLIVPHAGATQHEDQPRQDRPCGERDQRIRHAAQRGAANRLQQQHDQRRHPQRDVEARKCAPGQRLRLWRRPQLIAQHRPHPDGRVDRLCDHARRHRAGGHRDARQRADQVAGQQHAGVRRQPYRRPDPDGIRMAEPNQHALIEAAIGNRPCPGRHEHQPQAGRLHDLGRRADDPLHDEVIEGRECDRDVQRRQYRAGADHVAANAGVGRPVLAQRGRRRQEHDDWRLDDQRDGEDHAAVGGQVDLRIWQPRHGCGQRRQLDAHQQPTGSQRPPR